MVNDLRIATGAGLLDCKKALTEADGNVEAATTIAARARAPATRALRRGRTDRTGWLRDIGWDSSRLGR